jgi:hypothetical protein
MNHEPNGWGSDRLTDFFDAASANMRATFVHKKFWVDKLIGINDVFQNGEFKSVGEDNLLVAFLMSRSHSAYRAACHLGLAAYCADSYALSRSCLENALMANFLWFKPDLQKLWFSRHDSADERKKCRDEFKYARLLKCLQDMDMDLGKITDFLYQSTIDMGAHPNERSVTANLDILREGDETVYRIKSLHADGPALEVSLKTVTSVGIAALRIFEKVLPEHFSELGLTSRIQELSVGV